MKNFDEFFLSNLTDLKKEAQTKNPHKAFDNVPGSPKKNMTLAEYKEQVKQRAFETHQDPTPTPTHGTPTKLQPESTTASSQLPKLPSSDPGVLLQLWNGSPTPVFYNEYPGYQNQTRTPIMNPNPMVNMANNQYPAYQNSNLYVGGPIVNMTNSQYSGYKPNPKHQ